MHAVRACILCVCVHVCVRVSVSESERENVCSSVKYVLAKTHNPESILYRMLLNKSVFLFVLNKINNPSNIACE